MEVEADDLQREIIQAALKGKVLSVQGAKLTTIFTDGTEPRTSITTGSTGSLVATSPSLVVVTQAAPLQMKRFGEMVDVKEEKKVRNRKAGLG